MLVFPEGRKGTEKLYKDRYRLRRFGRGGFVEAAMRAEAQARAGLRRRRRGGAADLRPAGLHEAPHRAPLLPGHPDLPVARARSGCSATCRPSSSSASSSRSTRSSSAARGRAGQGAGPDGRAGDPRADPGEPARDGRRRGSRCGSDERSRASARRDAGTRSAGAHHRPLHLLGRPAGAGARGLREIEAIIGVDSREPRRELERTEFVKVSNQHSLIQRIVRAAEIDTVIDTRLVVDSLGHAAARRPTRTTSSGR